MSRKEYSKTYYEEHKEEILAKAKQRYYNKKNRYNRTCKVCGKKFETNDKRVVCCSDLCKTLRNSYLSTERSKVKQTRKCVICGTKITTTDSRIICCSEGCKEENNRRNALKRYHEKKDEINKKKMERYRQEPEVRQLQKEAQQRYQKRKVLKQYE